MSGRSKQHRAIQVPIAERGTCSWCERVEEQREIAAVLQTIDRRIAHLERKRATLQDLFKTLLNDLMTGRIRVPTDALAVPPDA